MLAANGYNGKEQAKGERNKFSEEDIKYLFVAALFHDYDPLKRFDKPHEDAVELFVRNDEKIRRFINEIDIDLDKVIAIIHRTAYPFKGEIGCMQRRLLRNYLRGQEFLNMILKHDSITRT